MLEGDLFLPIFAVGTIGALGAYILPTIIASERKHPKTKLIFLLNILTGWTGAGWVLLAVWALMDR